MSTVLPTDVNDNPIPAVRFKDGAAHAITTSGTSAKNSTAFADGTRIISIFATEDVYIKFGGSSATATTSDHFFPKNIYYDVAIGGDATKQYTHIAALQVSTAGTLYVSEKE
ncbi:MAG: hypothetical protein H6867_03035 [Rhodospirillales bacterium]|nr:hypothetical protein [Rhodospirillales bacterium]MCB9996125.1 hypothetical protein [Rhodospirillales bacterium]